MPASFLLLVFHLKLNNYTKKARSLKVHIMHEKKQAPETKKKREKEKKNYFKMEVTSNNTKSKLMICTPTKIVWILGFVSLSHEFLVFWLQTEIMLLGCFFALVFFLGLHFGSCGNETVCIL